ncbi:AraC family transcriptional regulator [Embleya scabrispora]|uniref:AraC family transcriptional regulator n=1 Tax=Embleya scabrispora TaxID=159449 RepID=A0A1T3NRN6_9ACTN|nr:helix-turn-helix domain-containing protein [Embleya scabrispora]OPC79583.1 AraC family transcriptional regulator [Embleya scabrispora]
MATVALAVTEGVTIFEVALPCEVFGVNRSDIVDPWYDFTVCAPGAVRFGDWFRTDTAHGLDALVAADTVVVPACRSVHTEPPPDLVDAVRAAHEAGARVASICSGAFILAEAGLLDGRRATTHWMHAAQLAARYPRVRVDPDVLYIDDGSILTSAGKAAGLDLCLHIVRTDHGAAAANALARRLVVPPHRPGGQAQFVTAPVPSDGDHRLAELLDWILANLERPLAVRDLARRANVSTRTLDRRFHAVTGTTPLRWLLNQRIRRAQELLEMTDDSVERIAVRTGMGTATTLRRHFNRTVGVPPDAYRRTFRGDARQDGGRPADAVTWNGSPVQGVRLPAEAT